MAALGAPEGPGCRRLPAPGSRPGGEVGAAVAGCQGSVRPEDGSRSRRGEACRCPGSPPGSPRWRHGIGRARGPREERVGEAGLARPSGARRGRGPTADGGAAEALRRGRGHLQEHLRGLPSGRRAWQGQAGRQSRRLAVRDRAPIRRASDSNPGRGEGRDDRPDAAARTDAERRADCCRRSLISVGPGATQARPSTRSTSWKCGACRRAARGRGPSRSCSRGRTRRARRRTVTRRGSGSTDSQLGPDAVELRRTAAAP